MMTMDRLDIPYDALITHIAENWHLRRIATDRQRVVPAFVCDQSYLDHLSTWMNTECAKLTTEYIILTRETVWYVDPDAVYHLPAEPSRSIRYVREDELRKVAAWLVKNPIHGCLVVELRALTIPALSTVVL